MADEEAEQDRSLMDGISKTIGEVRTLLEGLHEVLIRESTGSPVQSSSKYCQEFCRTLLEFVGLWKTEEEPLPLVHVYLVALLSFAKASSCLSLQCESVPLVIERLSLSFLELLLAQKNLPDDLWQYFKSSVQFAHSELQENGITQLSLLCVLSQHEGIWNHKVLQSILSNETPTTKHVEEFLELEGAVLLQMRVKQLMKEKQLEKAAHLAKVCNEYSAFQTKGDFKQMYLVCLCGILEKDQLMLELSKEDCHDALEMICNLESDGDDHAALSLCSAFLTRQLLQGDTYCAWELTLFWSKLLKRLEPSDHAFLDRCRQMSVLSKSVYHILFFIKVIQSEINHNGLPVCIELCIMALRITSEDDKGKATVCKTISCLLPADLEVKRACQLTEFLLEPTVDSYYVVETLYNEPDQKLEEESMPISNCLRCELLLVLKTQWPFDPEFWDWKTLKRHCLSLMGNEASIVSSIDSLNDSENTEEEEDYMSLQECNNIPNDIVSGTYEIQDVMDRKQKNREMKKLREKGFVSTRFRNWQAYMQYCVLCDKEFLGHRIVRHAQIHLSSGIYTCPICAQTFTSKDTLLPHVTSHVKVSCKERLTAMKTNKAMVHSKMAAPPIAILKVKAHNELKEDSSSLQQNCGAIQRAQAQVDRRDVDINEDNVCPVGKCKRSFKFFKNLIAHVKGHGDNEEARTFLELQNNKVVCQYCRRHFISVTHLNDHLQVHCGAKPYICIQLNCKASFLTNTKLLIHKKTHSVFKARCMFPKCGKIFNAPFKLYDHEAHHYKTFTCKAFGCGKVFHSQQQLDLHLDNHATQDQESPPCSQSSSNTQLGSSSLSKQMLSSQSSVKQGTVKQEYLQETLNSDASAYPKDGELMTIQSLPETSQEHVDAVDGCQLKSESPQSVFPTDMYNSNNSLIRSVHSHLLDSNKVEDKFDHKSLDCEIPPQSYPIHPFEASVGELVQSLPHTLPSKGNSDIPYKSNHNFMLPTQLGPVSCRNHSVVSLPHIFPDSAMSQPLPPDLISQQLTESNQRNLPSNITVTSSGQIERFHCAFGACTKNYSSYRSVSKHMKAVHPDFYEQWKVARTDIRLSHIPAQNAASGPSSSVSSLQKKQASRRVQKKNVIPPNPCVNMSTTAQCSIPHNLPSFPHNPNSSMLMANVLNPIVLSQLGADRRPVTAESQVTKDQNPVTAESEDVANCNSSKIFPSTQQIMQEIDSTSDVFPLCIPSCSAMGSKINQPQSLQPQRDKSRPQSSMSSCIQRSVESSQQMGASQPCIVQMESSAVPLSNTPEKTNSRQNDKLSDFSIAEETLNRTFQPNYGPTTSKESSETQTQAKKHTRTKWPAIIKDGKFFCRRCFRQFDNPRSLGGHLSKRTVCKPYQESGINTDLPQSFLDLLSSSQTVATSQSLPFYNGVAVYQKPDKRLTDSSSATKHPTLQNSQNNLPTFENSQSNNIFKQLMTESSTDSFVPPPDTQPLFQNSCSSHAESEDLLGTSVIKHTETVQLMQQANSYSATHSPESHVDKFPGNKLSDLLLSEVLTENSSSALLCNTPKISRTPELIFHESYPSKRTMSTLDEGSNSVKQTFFPDYHLSQTITIGKQTMSLVKTTDKDVKKRLREQILAGDFQRRNVFPPGNMSENASGSVCSPSSNSGFRNLSHEATSHSTAHEEVLTRKSSVIAESSGEIENLLNTQSFTSFRQTPRMLIELPSLPVTAATNRDPGPSEFSASQQQRITEIQYAFERLDLVREKSDQLITLKKNEIDSKSPSVSSEVTLHTSVPSTSVNVKPFACENINCTFSSISSDALWKHLSKTHNYTLEMVNAVKKKYGQYAPFKCQKCPKAFTRNSNLRIHYRTAHKLSTKEIADLDVKRKLAKAEASNASRKKTESVSQVPMAPITTANQSTSDNCTYMCPLQSSIKCHTYVPCANTTNHKYQGDNHFPVIHPLKVVPKHNQEQTPLAGAHTVASLQSVKAGISTEHWSKQQRNLPEEHAKSQQFPLFKNLSATPEPTNENGYFKRGTVVKTNNIVCKSKGKKPKSRDAMSPYRPYRCVHQGCEAAFTIQHNLILHYKAVHQSALSALEVSEEHDQSDDADELMDHDKEVESLQITEFRCQVKDCCCVFQEIPYLFQHYLHLHEFTDCKVEALLSAISLSRFACGHQGCTETFTTFRKYKSHVKEQHKDLNFARPEPLHILFKCEIEGCDRSYATKSNMLRHMMKKHQDLYQLKLQNKQVKEDEMKQNSTSSHYQITKTSNGKENIESNKKIPQRAHDRKKVDKSKSKHWLKYGKPSLKSKVDASALCTMKFPLQYPCMIKGCTSVMKSEKSILKHYIGHGLSEKYLEQHRSHFIFCKKFSRQKCRSIKSDDSKSENTSEQSDTEKTTDTIMGEGKYEYSKPVLRRRSPAEIPSTLFNTKLSNKNSSEGAVVLKRKRGRPRKFTESFDKPKKVIHPPKVAVVVCKDNTQTPPSLAIIPEESEQTVPLASFKPMGFEMSFLKFLEQTNKSEQSLMGSVKGTEKSENQTSSNSIKNCVWFSNHQNLKSLSKVKIKLDPAFSSFAEPMLKQLQDMDPAVVLEKCD
ncbi:zinc finger protein 292b [Fundulus heteroclitus]|uniref:zinc finger protein 292b n=1 Tax=Fundulus heteroclitus TaxID=8078 RepID=UPI00165B343B|nr:zinc finger protein 292b [Fundulus heteroclitus]